MTANRAASSRPMAPTIAADCARCSRISSVSQWAWKTAEEQGQPHEHGDQVGHLLEHVRRVSRPNQPKRISTTPMGARTPPRTSSSRCSTRGTNRRPPSRRTPPAAGRRVRHRPRSRGGRREPTALAPPRRSLRARRSGRSSRRPRPGGGSGRRRGLRDRSALGAERPRPGVATRRPTAAPTEGPARPSDGRPLPRGSPMGTASAGQPAPALPGAGQGQRRGGEPAAGRRGIRLASGPTRAGWGPTVKEKPGGATSRGAVRQGEAPAVGLPQEVDHRLRRGVERYAGDALARQLVGGDGGEQRRQGGVPARRSGCRAPARWR